MKKPLFKILLIFVLPALKCYWFLFRPKTTGVKCVLQHKNQVLLIRNSYGLQLWTLPGGGVKHGESLTEAVVREVHEEVGVTIQQPKKCGSIFYDGEYKRNTIWVFAVDVPSLFFDTSSLEIEEVRWFDINQLPRKKSHLLTQFLKLTMPKRQQS